MEDHKNPSEANRFRVEDSVGFLIGRLKARMAMALDSELLELDITHAQWVILVRIANGLGRTASELCRCAQCDTGSMTRMLDRLEEKQLIVRERSEEDRRIVEIKLTEHGQALYPALLEAGNLLFARMRGGFSDAEIDQLKQTLRRMCDNLDPNEVAE